VSTQRDLNNARSADPAGFDFTLSVQRLCADLCGRLDDLRHVDTSRVAVRYCQTRKAVPHGVQATLTPLRFEDGSLHTTRSGRPWTIQRMFGPGGHEMLYLLSFYLPRFLNLPFREKLATVIHELWHISPKFDGDLRRFSGRCYAHGQSEQAYHAEAARLAERWLALSPPLDDFVFLHHDFRQLRETFGVVYGARIATPKLIPADTHAA
jgi:predicted metallopeptidase